MTAATPNATLRSLSRVPMLQNAGPVFGPGADSGDRIFVTLLSLKVMLLAFFVVLGTAASFDAPRAASVAKSMHVVFAPTGNLSAVSPIRLTARQALQAGVAEAFADILPMTRRVTGDNGDRVDIDLSTAELAASGDRAREEMLNGIATLMRSAPAGLRYELVLDGEAAAVGIADALLARGVLARQLLIGSTAADTGTIKFSFLLLEGDDDSVYTRLLRRTP
jgi:hypothetical protein